MFSFVHYLQVSMFLVQAQIIKMFIVRTLKRFTIQEFFFFFPFLCKANRIESNFTNTARNQKLHFWVSKHLNKKDVTQLCTEYWLRSVNPLTNGCFVSSPSKSSRLAPNSETHYTVEVLSDQNEDTLIQRKINRQEMSITFTNPAEIDIYSIKLRQH